MAKKTKKEMAADRLAYQDEDLNSIEDVSFDDLTEEEQKNYEETE